MMNEDQARLAIPADQLKALFRTMVACREFENRLYNLFLTETMPGTMHQYTGQEIDQSTGSHPLHHAILDPGSGLARFF